MPSAARALGACPSLLFSGPPLPSPPHARGPQVMRLREEVAQLKEQRMLGAANAPMLGGGGGYV